MQRAKADYFGVKFHELAKFEGPIWATVCFGDKRILFEGNLTIDKTEGSYQYNPELQIHLWATSQPKIETRAFNNGYSRIEICMPLSEGLNFLYDSLLHFHEAPKKSQTKPIVNVGDVL